MKNLIESMLNEVGVTINGDKPYDIKVHDQRLFSDILLKQSIGAGEAYMKGMWDCDQLDELFYRLCRDNSYTKVYSKWKSQFITLRNSLINQQTPEKSVLVAKRHYNLGNKLFERMLGPSMAYTCGYWKNAETLDEAEFGKYDLTCKKLQLKPGEKVLEIGCGWGGLAKFMAEKYGVEVVGMDIGKEPASYAKKHTEGLPVKIFECDYRATHIYNPNHEKFDKIVSVGVLEHVGYKNYETLLTLSREFIKDDGIFLLHSIGRDTTANYCDPWIDKYIFPNGHLPSLKQLGERFEGKFVVEDHHNFGAYYDKTLMAWHENLTKYWPELKSDYDERFHRMMNYYLLSCAGGFRARSMQLWQFVLTPKGKLRGYESIR